jgi:hypothetical protein
MSEEAKMWETLQCLPDAVEHLIHGDPDDDDAVKASDAVKWAIAEIARLREERRWVPVGERLPPDNVAVLCWVDGCGAEMAWREKEQWFLSFAGYRISDSTYTHWQPLPPGPEAAG